jgi:hypothetical protein
LTLAIMRFDDSSENELWETHGRLV